MACRCAIAKALLNFYEVLRDRVRQSREVKQVPWSSAEPEVTIMHQSHKGQEKESDLIRPGRGVYTQKPFLAVSVFFYTFGIVTFGAMRFWYGRVEALCR